MQLLNLPQQGADVPRLVCLQDFHSLATYLSQFSSPSFLGIVSDFHLLLFLVTNEVMPLRVSVTFLLGLDAGVFTELGASYRCYKYLFGLWLSLQDSIGLLLDAVKTSNEDLAQTWKKLEQWATIEQLCSKSILRQQK